MNFWESLAPTLAGGHGFALATVISTTAGAPHPPGTQMALLNDGSVVGSLSGGCIEADVLARAEDVSATGEAAIQDYGYSDATALGVGLTCGGSIRVYLEYVAPEEFGLFRELLAHLRRRTAVATVTRLGGDREITLTDSDLLRQGRSALVNDSFVRVFTPPERLIIFGANAFASALASLASVTGYRVTVCDARATFATRERFPTAEEIVVRQPHRYLAELAVDERTVLCAMTHDPKFDDPLLATALRTNAGFIGAMGSRLTTRERHERLRALGVSEEELARLHAPFGLDLGGHTPEEAAVSMLAEIISARRGGSNRPLSQTEGRIHREG